MYIYNRKGKCLFYKEWLRPLNTLLDDPEEEKKLVFGMIYSLKDLTSKLTPDLPSNSSSGNGSGGLQTVRTNAFSLHHYQSVSGIIFVLNLDPDAPYQSQVFDHIYSTLYVDYVVRNPLYRRQNPDEPISSPIFQSKLEEYLVSQNLLAKDM